MTASGTDFLAGDTRVVSASKSEPETVETFIRELTGEERTLLVVRDELYSGSWDEMLKDLAARLQAKPYVFKLATRIEDDIVRIQRMRDFEDQHNVNLKDHV